MLKPGGHLGVIYTTRDDTVPWVKRLTALLQQVDPTAMRGDFGAESVATVAESPYFGPLERKNIRAWVPITRAGLVKTVERRPSVAQLDPQVRADLLARRGKPVRHLGPGPRPLAAAVPDLVLAGPS